MSEQIELTIKEHTSIIIGKLKQQFGEKKITLDMIDLIIKECIELVEKLKYSGAGKKEYVVAIVKAVIIDLVEDPDEERLLLEIIDKKLLEKIIDLIVSASKGKIDINNKKTQEKILSVVKKLLLFLVDLIIQLINKYKKKPKTSEVATTSETSKNADEMSIIIDNLENSSNEKIKPTIKKIEIPEIEIEIEKEK